MRRDFRQRDDAIDLIKAAPGADLAAVQARIDKLLDAQFPTVKSQDQQQYKDDITKQVNQILYLVYALLSLSIIVSLFGIVNTLVLSIHERTRELGMMRAIGTSRRQVRRIVRYESLITAMIGGVLGLVVGLAARRADDRRPQGPGLHAAGPGRLPDHLPGGRGHRRRAGRDPAGPARVAARRARGMAYE